MTRLIIPALLCCLAIAVALAYSSAAAIAACEQQTTMPYSQCIVEATK